MRKTYILFMIWIFFLITVYGFFLSKELAKKTIEIIKQEEKIKNNTIFEKIKYEEYIATAYTAGYESTGKNSNDPLFGITASGEIAIERKTIACAKELKFGTKIYIPIFDNVFTCEDRGSAITSGRIDIYMQDLQHAKIFGIQKLKILILPIEPNYE